MSAFAGSGVLYMQLEVDTGMFPKQLDQRTLPPTMPERSNGSTPLPTLGIASLFDPSLSGGCVFSSIVLTTQHNPKQRDSGRSRFEYTNRLSYGLRLGRWLKKPKADLPFPQFVLLVPCPCGLNERFR